MTIWLVRHAEAVSPNAGVPDEWRELTPAGRRQARRLGRRLLEQGERPDMLLTSPLVRAIQTAELMAYGMAYRGTVEISQVLIPGKGDRPAYLDAVRRCPQGAIVALVGHNPDLGAIASDFLGEPFQMPKGSLFVVRLGTRGKVQACGYWAPDAHGWQPL